MLETLYGAGYVDIAYKLGQHAVPTVPGAAFPDAEFAPFRADYFLASKALSHGAKSYAVACGTTGPAKPATTTRSWPNSVRFPEPEHER